jgi:hypothetical protein
MSPRDYLELSLKERRTCCLVSCKVVLFVCTGGSTGGSTGGGGGVPAWSVFPTGALPPLSLLLCCARAAGHGSDTRLRNRVRSKLTTFFKDRDCVTLKRPIIDEEKLQVGTGGGGKVVRPVLVSLPRRCIVGGGLGQCRKPLPAPLCLCCAHFLLCVLWVWAADPGKAAVRFPAVRVSGGGGGAEGPAVLEGSRPGALFPQSVNACLTSLCVHANRSRCVGRVCLAAL